MPLGATAPETIELPLLVSSFFLPDKNWGGFDDGENASLPFPRRFKIRFVGAILDFFDFLNTGYFEYS